MRLGKIFKLWVKLKTYPQISNVISNDNFGLSLYIVFTVYYIVIILDNKILEIL